MPTPEVPEDLQDLFIEYLSDNRDALKTCSTVSKRWNRRSRKLFCRDLKAVIAVRRKAHTTYSEDFVKLVESPHSTIATFICKLIILGPEPSEDSEEATSSVWNINHQEEYLALDIFLPRLVSHLSNLRKITLLHVVWDRLPMAAQLALMSFSAQELEWRHVAVDNPAAGYSGLMAIILNSGLKRLQLFRIETLNRSMDSYAFSTAQTKALSSLSILEVTSGGFVNPLLAALQRIPPRFHTVHLHIQTTEHFPLIAKFIRHLGKELTHLTLGGKGIIHSSFFGENAGERSWSPLSLKDNTNLQTIHIRGFCSGVFILKRMDGKFFEPDPLLALLDTMESSSLKELHISFTALEDPIEFISFRVFDKGLTNGGPSAPIFRLSLDLSELPYRGLHEDGTWMIWGKKIVYTPPVSEHLAQLFPRLYEQRRLIFEVDGKEVQLYPSA